MTLDDHSAVDKNGESFEERSDRLMSRMLRPESRKKHSGIPLTGTYRRGERKPKVRHG